MNGYPNHQTYRELYPRYLKRRDLDGFMRLMGSLKGVQFLELCCGEGQLTRAALYAGATRATVVDAESSMIPIMIKAHPRVDHHELPVREALTKIRQSGKRFDVAACRQAVNYWLTDASAADLVASVLNKGGNFVFNTFNKRPAKKPRVLEYQLGGNKFVETSWLVGDVVHHVQIREGMAPHATSFSWITPGQFRERLEPFFKVRERRFGKGSLWHCVRK